MTLLNDPWGTRSPPGENHQDRELQMCLYPGKPSPRRSPTSSRVINSVKRKSNTFGRVSYFKDIRTNTWCRSASHLAYAHGGHHQPALALFPSKPEDTSLLPVLLCWWPLPTDWTCYGRIACIFDLSLSCHPCIELH